MAKQRVKARHEQQAALRAEAQRAQQRRSVIGRVIAGVAAVVVAGAVGYHFVTTRELDKAVTTASYPAGMHVAGTIAYTENPPVGGPHNLVWQNCGIYTAPIHNEHAVHALEHGAVWITYRPDLPADQVGRLRTLASDDFMLLSPYPGLPAPVVASAWNHQVRLENANDARLPRFIARFKNNPSTTPEFGAPCAGGTSVTAEADSLNTGTGPMGQ
jgi:hypothetical protein